MCMWAPSRRLVHWLLPCQFGAVGEEFGGEVAVALVNQSPSLPPSITHQEPHRPLDRQALTTECWEIDGRHCSHLFLILISH